MEFVGQGSLGYHFGALEGGQNDYREALRQLTSVFLPSTLG